MNYWTIAFIAVEALLLGTVLFTKWQANRRGPTSADVTMGDEIGSALLIGLAVFFAVIAFVVYAWHHFRYAS